MNKNTSEKELTGYPSIDKPWLKYYSEEAINAPLPECTVYEYLWENNKDYLDDTAIIYFNAEISYRELFKNIELCAKALIAKGVKQNDIVTIAMPNIPEVVYAVYAINRIGAIANMIHPLAGEQEICNYINEVNSRIILMFSGTYDVIFSMINKTSVECAVVVSPESPLPCNSVFIDWEKFIDLGKNVELKDINRNCHSISLISHTGGTTGTPKGVMMSDYSINAEIWQIGCNLPHERQECTLVVLPPFVNYSLANAILEPLAFGFKVVLIPDYRPEMFDKYIEKYHPNHINSIPPYWEAVLDNVNLKEMDLSCLKHIFYGGDGLNLQTEEKINNLLCSRGGQFKLAKGLGSTEMVSAATITYSDCNLAGSVGIPLVKNNCKIIEPETQRELTYGQEGEICFSGPTMMQGYYKNKGETDEIIKVHKDGERWVHTGDLGYMTEDGVLYVSGRIKRIIMTKGTDGNVTKIFPDRIEKIVACHPAVNQCCVIGVPDNERIYYPYAAIVLNNDVCASEQLKAEIIELCCESLPMYMIPDKIEFLSEMPRTARGKIDYHTLEKIAEELD